LPLFFIIDFHRLLFYDAWLFHTLSPVFADAISFHRLIFSIFIADDCFHHFRHIITSFIEPFRQIIAC